MSETNMANEISVASMVSDGALAEFIVADYQARNAQPNDIRAALDRVEWNPNSGSSSQRTGIYDDDHVFVAASSEISGGASNADPDWGYFALTPARRLLPFRMTDLIAGTRGPNGADPSLFVGMMLRATGKTVTDMACAVAATATAEVGDGTGPMTVDLFHEAIGALDNGTPGPYAMVLTTKAYNQFQESLRGEGGSATFNDATEQQLSASWGSYRGSWRNVAIYVSDKVDTTDTGSVAQNFMLGRNGIRYTEAPVGPFMADAISAGAQVLDLGSFGVEFDRDAANGMTTLIGNYYPAVSLGEDSAVVRIQTATGA
jgi:hypothetical protein